MEANVFGLLPESRLPKLVGLLTPLFLDGGEDSVR
jgi:hypothetical protein